MESIDGIVAAIYDVISGPAGGRDWDRERSLFLPGARLVPTRPLASGGAEADVFDVEGYIASRTPLFAAQEVWETEIARQVFVFGNFAHVLSSYELRRSSPAGGELPPVRGVNSIQLFNDGRRWWITAMIWDNERPGVAIPESLLAPPADQR
ncbi:MAG TPA: hypothetical protein VHG32_08130 [Thermoanaerobaculia bacterium]|nr:hypothetical protein [Thermoanaerobaculia bacterium]